jgi:two-component system, cell cycle response regulator
MMETSMKQQGTILVVDDQQVMRETIAMMLQGRSYRLEFANNGVEALRKAEQLSPNLDLVLLDVMMPEMDGLEVCRRLRRHEVLGQVPIIMITALADRESWMEGMEAGADDYVFKPFDTAELRTRIRNVIQLNRYRRLMVERTKFEWVVGQAVDGIIMLDDQQRITYANRQARLFLGLPPDETPLAPTPFMRLVGQQYHREPREAWSNWPAETPAGMVRYLLRPESATAIAFWLEIDNLQLPNVDNGAHLIRLRNVTSEMSLQQEIWRFQSMVLHKMRTPLITIMNGYELLVRHSEQISPAEIKELASAGLSGAKRLKDELEAIHQFLHAPNLAAGGQGFAIADLTNVINKLGRQLGLPPVVMAGIEKLPKARLSLNPQAMEAILYQLLENSQKFHPEKKPQVQLFIFESNAREVTIWVGDDGINLTPDQIAQAWTPYYQAEKRFTGEVSGMGLGLPMVAAIVWSIGGSCRIYNRTTGPGVVVELVLPLQPAAE